MIHDALYDRDRLPPWFQKPDSIECRQSTLFPDELPDVLATLRVSADDLTRWHTRGWVSFGPDLSLGLESWHVNEIRFVRDVVRSGLLDAQIEHLFRQLPRPMNFDPATVAYSFSLGWVMVNPPEELDPDEVMPEHIGDWLVTMADAGELEQLIALRDRIEGLLEAEKHPDEDVAQ